MPAYPLTTRPSQTLVPAKSAAAATPAARIEMMLATGARMLYPNIKLLGHRHVGRVLSLGVDARGIAPEMLRQMADFLRDRSHAPYVRVVPREDGAALFEMPMSPARDVLLDHRQADRRGEAITLGPLMQMVGDAQWNTDAPEQRHALIVAEGIERTMLLRTLLCQLARRESAAWCRMVIIDPIAALSESLRTLAHQLCVPVGPDPFEQRLLLEWVGHEVLRRINIPGRYARLVVVITEGGNWLSRFSALIDTLLTHGAAANINLIIATDQIKREVLASPTAQRFKFRLVGQTDTEVASNLAAGRREANCHWQVGHGDTLLLPQGMRFQCPTVGEDLIDGLPHATALLDSWALINQQDLNTTSRS